LGGVIVAFGMENQGSREIHISQVLPGLAMGTIVEALRRSVTENDTDVSRWLMQEFSTIG
jgi:hypothetical protein